MLRVATLRKPFYSSSSLSRFRAPRFTLAMSTSQAHDIKPFDPRKRTKYYNNDGESFVYDEEPLMSSPDHGSGYCHVTLGQQVAKGKLEIVRKLGWGGYSSVWLARTLQNSFPVKYVAVKILTVHATAGLVNGFLGEGVLRDMKKAKSDHPGYKHTVQLYDTAVEKSFHGPHICFITKVLGANVGTLIQLRPNGSLGIPVRATKRIVKQTLLALDFLHRECKYVHTDLKLGNILVRFDHDDESIDKFLQCYPSATYEPRIEPSLSPDPIITVKSQPLPHFNLRDDASNVDICLIDFGNSTPIEKHMLDKVQDTHRRAPEVILDHEWSTPIDIWNLGCLVYECFTTEDLFEIFESPTMTLDHSLLQRIVERVCPFPPAFLEACKRRDEFFDQEGSLLRTYNITPNSIETTFRSKGVMDQLIPPAVAFIRRCLTIDPNQRPTALELLDDEWLKDA